MADSTPNALTPDAHRRAATRVLQIEGEALLTLAQALPGDFAGAVAALLDMRGRAVLSGIGKSGHVARKIAATLASTGTPSLFVHPAEASHGDLGMVMPGDICILLSNSGETSELRDMISHCARFDIPLIGLSRDPESTLMRAADFRLTIPDLAEACAIGMAPTTSTTLMMGLGDALAVALMEARRFEAEQFRTYHPGGKLGAQLTLVRQVMHAEVPLVPLGAPMQEVVRAMTAGGLGVTGVVDAQGLLAGVVTDGDLRRNIVGLLDREAGDVASRSPKTVAPQTLAAEALAIVNKLKISVLFVCEDGRPVGIVHLHDLLRIGVM
ncbi:MAG: KpsF/GutQ family sugar-phosphate isomerase [Pseudotabrizicola sp.]|uniref:KpsF/GutQ family sugar-phosphate isomerase n=1 Tax=Pseudotabrizicola sp. TaxID=2939647 RepID=UPI00271689D4|nr:KpsF/GutQ family sugar-phosphate isomerase [Pseudotabrizicola sp.]MDO8883091.1 KpsF/GutQ family sugar-phosphate isomerase [Pseudotabrizicola sp.]MDP2082074.1 KpsF/GutQ family sugar-phosphate isomerase [Pseudotabrizicola sp.]MDZ7576467.1 KpsF/GutQ family sugar-phosphate isomerase [Pseudotabrizicola sp.]